MPTQGVYWLAEFEYRNDLRELRTLTLIFQSNGYASAILDVVRYWAGRQRAMPDVFAQLLCVKVFAYTVPTIREDGTLSGPHLGLFNAEWKIDTAGRSLEAWAEAEAVKYAR